LRWENGGSSVTKSTFCLNISTRRRGISQGYETGVKLTQTAMAELEKQLHRLPELENWFVEIPCNNQ
jgi:hypothetical protein